MLFRSGKRVKLPSIGIFADGVAVKQVGKEPFRIASKCVDDMVLATTDEICAAIKDIFDDTRSIAEPAGALALAGLKKYVTKKKLSNKNVIAILSGANINFDRLRHVSERAEIGEYREALFAVKIPEKPGSFKTFCKTIGKRSVTEFNYRYSDPDEAVVFVGIQLSEGLKEKDMLLSTLKDKGFDITDLTQNEMAKLHLRHMVGGRAPQIKNEVIYRFQFPERPGALIEFLNELGETWNISVFHYRNHGAAYGRVLAGIQVPPKEKKKFQDFIKNFSFNVMDETDNPAYKLFL